MVNPEYPATPKLFCHNDLRRAVALTLAEGLEVSNLQIGLTAYICFVAKPVS